MIDLSQGALSRDEILTRRSDSLATVDPEMKYLFQEYHDGLLLFEISTREVWDKAASDEVALKAWFETHRKNYTWASPRYKGIAYHVKDKKDVKAVRNCVKNLPFDEWTEALRSTFNSDSVIRIRVEKGLFRPGDNATVDKLVFKTGSEVVSLKDYPIDAVYGKKLKKPADYSDVRTQVVEDYQGYLERQWVEALRKRYPVSINQEVLKTVNKHQ
jgi:peptidyl-prolyl cis-trans isomerase SurA